MRKADDLRADLAAVKREREANQEQSAAIHRRTCRLMLEARQHPELTMEDARGIVGASRQTAYELAKEAEESSGSRGDGK